MKNRGQRRVRRLAEDALQEIATGLGVNPGSLDHEDVEATTQMLEGLIAKVERNAYRRGERQGALNSYA